MKRLVVVMVLATVALLISLGAVGATDSVTSPPRLHNCPQGGQWAISVWDGPPTAADEALATCAIAAAYSYDEGQWARWIAGRGDLTTLRTLDYLQGVITLGPGCPVEDWDCWLERYCIPNFPHSQWRCPSD